MDEEKKNLGETIEENTANAAGNAVDAANAAAESIGEVVGDAAETETFATTDAAETVGEESADATGGNGDTPEFVGEGEPVADTAFEKPEEPTKKSNKVGIIIGVIAAVVVVAAVIVCATMFGSNKYEKDYIDTTGKTIGEVADENGMEYDEFLELFGLPKDMPKSTSENAAQYNIPCGTYAEKCQMTFDEFKEALNLADDDSITEDTTVGDAFDKMTVGDRVGEDQLETFKETYELPDSVTADTLWGEVRNLVDQKLKAEMEAAENESEEEVTDEPEEDDEESSETPAETEDTVATSAPED